MNEIRYILEGKSRMRPLLTIQKSFVLMRFISPESLFPLFKNTVNYNNQNQKGINKVCN